MRPSNKTFERHVVGRRAYQNTAEEIGRSAGWLAATLIVSIIAGFIWPVTFWLSVPIAIFWVPIFMFSEFRMPLRMPEDMGIPDPSTEMNIPAKMWGILPFTVLRRVMSKSSGILYAGYQRIIDAGRELWISMDDLTRHVILLATTGAGKTEMLLGFVLNALTWSKGFIFSDGKAQNDVWFAIASLARRFGREDDLLVLNYITGGKSRAQRLLEGVKTRPQSNSTNPFILAQETYILQMMDGMLPDASNDGGWQEKAKVMNQALVIGLVYKSRKEGLVMSQRLIQEYMPLRKFVDLYLIAQAENWHEEAWMPMHNYLSALAGFDIDKVHTPAEWAEEAFTQHNYLIQQYTRVLSLFSDTYDHVFSSGAGDIDLRDVVHNDRILVVLIPALELSSSEATTLGRLTVSQIAMILSQDLGEKIEGKAEDILIIRKFKDRFPFLWIADEVGAYYTETFGHLATQVRSLGYSLILAGQDLQRLKTAAGDKIWTLISNMFTRIAGTLNDPKETLEMYQKAGGSEFEGIQDRMERHDGMFGNNVYRDSDSITVREKQRITVEEVQALNKGEQITIFRGEVTRGSSLYIDDEDKITDTCIRINRFIDIPPPSLQEILETMPGSVRRARPRQEVIASIMSMARSKKAESDHASYPGNIIITDGVLFTVAEEAVYCDEIEFPEPPPIERATRMLSLATAMLQETRGTYRAEVPEPAKLSVSKEMFERYNRYHQTPAATGGSYGQFINA